MTPTKAELREALEVALSAIDEFGEWTQDYEKFSQCTKAFAVLRAFLDSGLTDDERETVRWKSWTRDWRTGW